VDADDAADADDYITCDISPVMSISPVWYITCDDYITCGTGEPVMRPVKPGGGDAAVDDTVHTRASPQLALLPRYQLILHPADTAIGTTSRHLVLNPDVLTPGRAYFAKVTAFSKRTSSFQLC